MPEASSPADRILELVDLAGRLKLTRLQTDFVLALVTDPKRNQTKAAIAAGASPKAAKVWASKTLRKGNVWDFLGNVEAGVRQRTEELAQEEARAAAVPIEQAVMDAAEHQLRLSRMGRADIGHHLAIDQDGSVEVRLDPDYTDIIRELRVEERADKDGMPVRRTTIKVADPVPALQGLARVKGWEKSEPKGAANDETLAILGAVSVEAFKAAYLKLIAGGNGHGGPGQG
jgi:phage terminase small subunit